MKTQIFYIPLLALFLSCNNSKPTYNKCIETTYNFRKEAVNKIVRIDTVVGSFDIKQDTDEIKITNKNKKDSILLSTHDDYILINKKNGDTLVIQNFPSKKTLLEFVYLGTEYKFYN